MNNVIHGDCLEVMKGFKDNEFDLCLTDPPYGISEVSGKNHSRNNCNRVDPRNGRKIIIRHQGHCIKDWDNEIPKKEVFDEMFRISKNQVIFGGNYFIQYLKNTPCFIIWDKVNGKSDFADCEMAWTSFKSATRLVSYMWSGFLQGKSILEGKTNQGNKSKCTVRVHPTQKPTELFSWILENYTKEGDSIIDPFAGGGTTAVSCINMNRKYTLIEKEKEYIDIINKRIYNHKDGNLFSYLEDAS